jgi:tRNA pseudouridine38-40 synthase
MVLDDARLDHRLREFRRDPANIGPARRAPTMATADLLRGWPIVCGDAESLDPLRPHPRIRRHSVHGPAATGAWAFGAAGGRGSSAGKVTGEAATLHAAGRTDAGVHALGDARACRRRQADRSRSADGGAQRITCARPGRGAGLRGGARRLARAVFLHWPVLSLPDRQPPRAADAGCAGAHGRCPSRSMPRRCTAPRRRWSDTRFHHLPLGHCQSQSPVKTLDRLSVRAGRRSCADRAAARSLPAPSGPLDGRLPRAGRHGPLAPKNSMAEALAARDRQALGLNARPKGSISSARFTRKNE